MLRTCLLSLCLLCLAAWCAIAVGCGGSSSAPNANCAGGPYNVAGDWQTTFTSGSASLTGYGVINSSGLALFFDNSAPGFQTGDTLELPSITGACYFSGSFISYGEPGSVQSGSTAVVTDSAQGNVTSATSITGTFSGTTSGKFTMAPSTPLSGSPVALSGTLTAQSQGAFTNGEMLALLKLNLTFAPTGTGASMSFSGSDGVSCNASGTFTEESTDNVFDVSITLAGASCAVTGSLTGLGFESNTDYFNMNDNTAGTYLYADILNSSNTFVLEIF
ncbi:MAG TPA: hypothetical protein VMD99_10615 [Terriglobales bacterium]|nr:hypothetical protein [Terriglobales bacterium]